MKVMIVRKKGEVVHHRSKSKDKDADVDPTSGNLPQTNLIEIIGEPAK